MRRIEQNGFFSASALFTFAVRSKIYITSFLIYANRTLDPGLCTGFQRTPYMDLLLDCFRKAPFYNKRLAMELTLEPEEGGSGHPQRHLLPPERITKSESRGANVIKLRLPSTPRKSPPPSY